MILNIYANPEQADQDRSGVLSVGEATALAVALSLDSLTVGVGAGLDQTPVFAAVLISFVLGLAAILLGRWLGDKPVSYTHLDVYKRQGPRRGGSRWSWRSTNTCCPG